MFCHAMLYCDGALCVEFLDKFIWETSKIRSCNKAKATYEFLPEVVFGPNPSLLTQTHWFDVKVTKFATTSVKQLLFLKKWA